MFNIRNAGLVQDENYFSRVAVVCREHRIQYALFIMMRSLTVPLLIVKNYLLYLLSVKQIHCAYMLPVCSVCYKY